MREYEPPYTVDEVLSFYDACGFDLGISVDHAGDRVRIAVTDNGVGIAPQHLTSVFRHGFTTKKNGHGFGLHSGANAAKEMGGSLTASSAGTGLGATFTLELPVAATAPA